MSLRVFILLQKCWLYCIIYKAKLPPAACPLIQEALAIELALSNLQTSVD